MPEWQPGPGPRAWRYRQDRTRGLAQNLFGDRSQHEVFEPARAVCAHHHDIRGEAASTVEDPMDGRPELDLHIDRHSSLPRFFEERGGLLSKAIERSGVDGRLERRDDVQRGNRGLVMAGDHDGQVDRMCRRVGEVRRAEDPADLHLNMGNASAIPTPGRIEWSTRAERSASRTETDLPKFRPGPRNFPQKWTGGTPADAISDRSAWHLPCRSRQVGR